eukprot:7364615-Prorocentrum_lima.AAC.1
MLSSIACCFYANPACASSTTQSCSTSGICLSHDENHARQSLSIVETVSVMNSGQCDFFVTLAT